MLPSIAGGNFSVHCSKRLRAPIQGERTWRHGYLQNEGSKIYRGAPDKCRFHIRVRVGLARYACEVWYRGIISVCSASFCSAPLSLCAHGRRRSRAPLVVRRTPGITRRSRRNAYLQSVLESSYWMDDTGVHRRRHTTAREAESTATISGAYIRITIVARHNVSYMITSRQTPTVRQARAMLGTFLVRRWHNREIASMITEVEAYDGPHDKASHASRGMTSRQRRHVWQGRRVVCVSLLWNTLDAQLRCGRHGVSGGHTSFAALKTFKGPGNVTKYFHVTGAQNGKAAGHLSGLWIEDRGVRVPKTHIVAVPRVGIPYAQDWKDKPLRFLMRK